MAQPRRVVPGATYLVTRRCSQRTFRLRPSDRTNHILMYCLARALQKTGVVLHAVCVMSNHHHLVITDPHGVLPQFLRELHRFSAKTMNASQGQWENLWSAEPCSAVRLIDADDIVDKIAYVAANPVAAGLVEKPEHWPGLSIWREAALEVRRPKIYFDANGESPERLTLRVESPVVAAKSDDARASWHRRLQSAIATKVVHAHQTMCKAGRTFLGRAGVLTQSFAKRAKTFEPKRVVVPTVAAKDRGARSLALRILKAFRSAYRHALESWREGVRDVVFPFGTWWMRVHHAAATARAMETG